jgi:hypothetical protein
MAGRAEAVSGAELWCGAAGRGPWAARIGDRAGRLDWGIGPAGEAKP